MSMSSGESISWGVTCGIDFPRLSQYARNLPHWRQEGAIYFVTFRLADSVPRAVQQQWIEDRQEWLAANGISAGLLEREQREQYAAIPEKVRRVFEREQARKFFVELDKCHGACWLRNRDFAKIVAEALQHLHGGRLLCGDFVVMPNHVHWLVLPFEENKLETLLQSIKGWSAWQINRLIGRRGRLWQKESHDHIVRTPMELGRIRDYIRQNPLKANLKSTDNVYHRAEWL